MSTQHKERAITQMTAERISEQPYFGEKQAHRLYVGKSGVLYQLVDESKGEDGIVAVSSRVDEAIEFGENGETIFALKPVNYGPRIWKKPEDLGIIPYEDGTWSASAWFKYQRDPKSHF